MARLTKLEKQKALLPPPGAALLMRLEDGRFGVCRVLRFGTEAEIQRQGAVQAMVAMSPWIGEEPPAIDDPRLRDILALTHHAFKEEPCVLWVGGAPPQAFTTIGTIEPTQEDIELACLSSSAWPWFPLQLLAQWRWDHERAEVLAVDQAEMERKAAANRNATNEYREYLDGLTLDGLLHKPRFEDWKGFVPAGGLRACQEAYRSTVQRLMDLGSHRRSKDVVRILRDCIHRINAIDDAHKHFVETIAREELAEELDEIAYAAGLRTEPALGLRWADW